VIFLIYLSLTYSCMLKKMNPPAPVS